MGTSDLPVGQKHRGQPGLSTGVYKVQGRRSGWPRMGTLPCGTEFTV